MQNNIYYRPVIPLVIAFMSGLAMGNHWPGLQLWVIPLIIVWAFFVLLYLIKKSPARISPLFLFFFIGYLSLQPWTAPDFSPRHVIHFTDSDVFEIFGTVVDTPFVKNNRIQFCLKVKTLSRNQQSPFTSKGTIRVTLIGDDPVPDKGDDLKLTSRIRAIRNFSNFGGFDYERFMAFQGIWGTAYSTSQNVILIKAHKNRSVAGRFDQLRRRIRILIDASGKQPETGVLNALILGDKSLIPEKTREAFVRAGLGHLLAISGLHVGIVATLSFFLFRRLLSFSTFLCWRGWVDKSAALLSLFPILFYGLISGMSPSTQRAVVMTIVFLLAFQVEREQDLLNTLALAALVILMIFPPTLFSVSFQLSFTAVGVIILGLSVLPKALQMDRDRLYQKWGKQFLSFLWVSLFAIMGTLPLSLYYFNQTSLIGLFANCIAVPLIGFVVIPMGIAASFLTPLSTFLATFGFKASIYVLNWGIAVIGLFSGFSFASIKTVTPSVIEMTGFYLLLGSACLLFKHPKAKWVMVVALVVLFLDGGYWINRRLLHNDFRVTVLDVGQGTASLLEFPKGHTILLDGGGFSDNASFDVGERIVAPYLWRNKIKTIDTLVLSHPNSDHLNGLIYIAENFHVKNLWTNNESVNTFGYKQLMSVVEKNKIHHPIFGSLPRTRNINGVEMKILNPSADFDPNGILAKVKGENNNSVVVKTVFGNTSILFSGDIQETAEEEILTSHEADLSSTVLICPHHGSKSSSTNEFVNRVNPQYVIITAGWQNRFNFPHVEVLERYRKQKCRIFRTDLDGAVKMWSNGQTLMIRSDRVDSGGV